MGGKRIAFSRFMSDLHRKLSNMEKEHLTHCVKGAPTVTHIVAVPHL